MGLFGHWRTVHLIFFKAGHLVASFQIEAMFQKMDCDSLRMWLSHSTLFTEIIVIKCPNDIKLFHGIEEYLLQQELLTERRFLGLEGYKQHENESQKWQEWWEGPGVSSLRLFCASFQLTEFPRLWLPALLKQQTLHYAYSYQILVGKRILGPT